MLRWSKHESFFVSPTLLSPFDKLRRTFLIFPSLKRRALHKCGFLKNRDYGIIILSASEESGFYVVHKWGDDTKE